MVIDHCSLIIFYVLGLYTHYAFPFVLVTHFFIVLVWTLVTRALAAFHRMDRARGGGGRAVPAVAADGAAANHHVAFVARDDRWRADAARYAAAVCRRADAAHRRSDLAIVICGLFILIGLWNPIGFDERRAEAHDVLPYSIRLGSIVLWWLVPIALIFFFGLFKESYLKFFIVGSAAFCILLAQGISNAWGIGRGALTMPRELAGRPVASWAWTIVVLALCAVIAVPTFNALRNYYFDPAYARDDYRSIAQQILKQQRPDDAVILDSANQWEVFTYYYPDGPNVYPLP